MSTKEAIRTAIKAKRPGTVMSASSFSDLGSREAVDQTLSRLAREGVLLRIARGKYVRPQSGRFGSFPPAASTVVKSLAKTRGRAIVESGAVSANRLGITTQQPIRQVFQTAGRGTKLALGKNTVQVLHVPKWQTMYANREAGRALRALAYAGKSEALSAARTIRRMLATPEWETLRKAKGRVPKWVSEAVEHASHD